MVNDKQIKVIFFDIGDVLLKIHPERMIGKISNCANIPYEVVERAFLKMRMMLMNAVK
jgi:hypothetical protein